MKRVAKKTILKVKPYVPGKPIEEVRRALGLRSVVKLASNENPYGPSPKACQAIVRASQGLNRYPDGDCYYLRKALSQRLKVSGEQFIFGNGSDELIVLAVRAFVSPGDEVVIANPSFLIYDIASRIAGAKIQAVPLKDFCYDLTAMKKAVTKKTKIVFLGNPDNPSGMYLTEDQVRTFLKGLRSDVLVFIDEAYFEYVEKDNYPDSINWLQHYPNLIVTRTFSKAYGLAGLRIGYGISNPELADLLNRVRQPFNNNMLALVAAEAALDDVEYLKQTVEMNRAGMRQLTRFFEDINLPWIPSEGNFIAVDMTKPAQPIYEALLKEGVIVRPVANYDLASHLRISIGTKHENQVFINALAKLSKYV